LEKAADANSRPALARRRVQSAVRFADRYPQDARTPAVLTATLHALGDGDEAIALARQVVALQPPAEAALRRTAWTVLAQQAEARTDAVAAERAWTEVLALTAPNDAQRSALTEHLAVTIYRQAEQARDAGDQARAARHFARVTTAAPASQAAVAAQFDEATALIALKDWNHAAERLEDFQRRYPKHALQAEVPAKLATVYLAQDRAGPAAAQFEQLAAQGSDATQARGALWQAAELRLKAGDRALAARNWTQYVQRYPQPLEPAIEARWQLAELAGDARDTKGRSGWLESLVHADRQAGAARTPRTRTLGARATLALAAPARDHYRAQRLVEPLAKTLKLKKARLEDALGRYQQAADYGVADVTTAATYEIAELYRDFAQALMTSERPKKLSALEREQYDVLLEEQAFPFEEKAIEVHGVNAQRARDGHWDANVARSYEALARLQPARYGKPETTVEVVRAID